MLFARHVQPEDEQLPTVTLANNVPLQDVSVMLGHASTRMTQHYARVMNSSLKEAMNNVKERLAQ